MKELSQTNLETIQQIKKYISKDKLEKGIDALLHLCESIYEGKFSVEATIIKRRYSNIFRKELLNTTSNQEVRVEENRISFDILNLLNLISDERRAIEQMEVLNVIYLNLNLK